MSARHRNAEIRAFRSQFYQAFRYTAPLARCFALGTRCPMRWSQVEGVGAPLRCLRAACQHATWHLQYNVPLVRKGVFIASVLIGLAVAAGFVILVFFRVPSASGRIVAQISHDWGSIPFGNGVCALVNNTWNRAAAGNGFEQSVFVENISGQSAVGWRWRAPWRAWPAVVSQPQIVCGNKPWDPRIRPDDGLPFLAGKKRLKANFDVRLRARGVYNMAFTL